MSKVCKLMVITSIFCFLMLILLSSASVADFTVNSNTSHEDINNWLDDWDTVDGNNLIFNVSSYELSDTLLLTKSINIKSDKKTQINFNQNKHMFVVAANKISFSGLVINNNGQGVYKSPVYTIFAPLPAKNVTIKDTSINLNKNYSIGVSIGEGNLNFINSNVRGNGIYNYGVYANNLNTNFQKSSITFSKNYCFGVFILNKLTGNFTNTKISMQSISSGITSSEWIGNFVSSEISGKSEDYGIYAKKWDGKISGSKIILSGSSSYGFNSTNSKGSIYKSTIHAKKGIAAAVSKYVKVSGSSMISKSGFPGVYYFGPRMIPLKVSRYTNSRLYTFKIANIGESKSKTSYLKISAGKFKKTVKVKGISPGKLITVKVILPATYSSFKYKKVANMIFYNSAGKKEVSKTLYFKF
ncbi:hypothetical protein [Methanobrevibacter sp.]|uniref:hypothetical protein n=1 Tax=Methanobrevibacter sp. TaxID=66852 RepID=UPI00260263D5|nr:hypothetical protein [uncultured Methanobrevibacter sp.]